MGNTKHLEVYKSSYANSREVFKLVRKFPKDLKYTLGKHFFNSAIELITIIVRANRLKQKSDLLEDAPLCANKT